MPLYAVSPPESVTSVYTCELPDASPSVVDRVPISVPAAAFSATLDAVSAMSVGELSLTFVTATVKVVAAVLESALVAVISTVQLVAVS